MQIYIFLCITLEMKLTYIFTYKFNETNAQTFLQFDQYLFVIFREVHTEQTVDEFSGPAADHQIDQIEVHVRDTIFIRRGYREEIVPQAAALLHTGIRACI